MSSSVPPYIKCIDFSAHGSKAKTVNEMVFVWFVNEGLPSDLESVSGNLVFQDDLLNQAR